jgi:hypothetical protein
VCVRARISGSPGQCMYIWYHEPCKMMISASWCVHNPDAIWNGTTDRHGPRLEKSKHMEQLGTERRISDKPDR